ncbi:MAG: penicillin acylase family protein [Desulfobacterales bacterium]|jgi:penicillin amidase|nr:penicillin acylase family protein [Desulfobacterales bacterium]
MKNRYLCFIMITCFSIIFPLPCLAADEIVTTRDAQGVWFINGPDDASTYDIFEAVGFAVATDRLWQMELYRRQATGRLAEIFGASQLETDVFMRTIGYSDDEIQAGFEAMTADSQDVILGYVAGINRRIAEITDPATGFKMVPFEFLALGILPEAWTVKDVLAWTATMQRFFDPEALDLAQIENAELLMSLEARFGLLQALIMFNDLRWTNDPAAPTYIDHDQPFPGFPHGMVKTSGSEKFEYKPGKAVKNMVNNRNKVIDNLKKINAYIKMGSYAWVVSGAHTVSGKPIIYSGPQMGFSVPSIVAEGSIRAGGLDISGMNVPGLPGIVIGRTPHHAWSMQVGHAHTTDYYFENPADVYLDRMETIKIKGAADIQLPVFRSDHGPIINPLPYNPAAYEPSMENPLVAWKYAHWGYEFDSITAFLKLARATSMNEFHQGIRQVAVSQHFCYADRDGNIAYWMSGRDPLRFPGEWRLPQGLIAGLQLEWDARFVRPLSHDRNSSRGWYAGWNNKSSAAYPSGFNSVGDIYGPFHRTHVIYDYFDAKFAKGGKVSFEEVRDLALNIATTDSFGGGGNPWEYVSDDFTKAVKKSKMYPVYKDYLKLLDRWNGHFVAGGPEQWVAGTDRADAWVLMDRWIRRVLDLTFMDELGTYDADGELVLTENKTLLFNLLLHSLGRYPGIENNYNWFSNLADPTAPQTAKAIIVAALGDAITELGNRPWGIGARGVIQFKHDLLGVVHTMPFSSRSTYAHCVAYGSSGPVRIESMFPLGESGDIGMGPGFTPIFDPNFFSMTRFFDNFLYREFPLFD